MSVEVLCCEPDVVLAWVSSHKATIDPKQVFDGDESEYEVPDSPLNQELAPWRPSVQCTDMDEIPEIAWRFEGQVFTQPPGVTNKHVMQNMVGWSNSPFLQHAVVGLLVRGVSRKIVRSIGLWFPAMSIGLQKSEKFEPDKIRFVAPVAYGASPHPAWRSLIESSIEISKEIYESFMHGNDSPEWGDIMQGTEVATSVLPDCVESPFIATANLHEWRGFIHSLGSHRSTLEARRLAIEVLKVLETEAPNALQDFRIVKGADGYEHITHDIMRITL